MLILLNAQITIVVIIPGYILMIQSVIYSPSIDITWEHCRMMIPLENY